MNTATESLLGRPLDGNGPVAASRHLPIERPAPPIMDRAPVTVPLQTGLKVINAFIPIGRGQHELILGVLPAVDVGKSVSRVGGKAQRAACRAVAGDLKLAYAQFEEASRPSPDSALDCNIDELLEDLELTFHRSRQSGIDEELFDVVSGFEALSVEEK